MMKIIIIFIIIFGALKCNSESDFQHEYGSWNAINISGKITDKILFSATAEPWLEDNLKRINRVYGQAFLGYKLNKNFSIWAGPEFAMVRDPIEHFAYEYTMNEMLVSEFKIKNLTINNRVRLQERFYSNTNYMTWRFRDRIRLTHPIGKSKLYAIASDEIFYDFKSPVDGRKEDFSQNRAFLGMGYKFNKYISFEAGYQPILILRTGNAQDLLRHTLSTQLNFNLP